MFLKKNEPVSRKAFSKTFYVWYIISQARKWSHIFEKKCAFPNRQMVIDKSFSLGRWFIFQSAPFSFKILQKSRTTLPNIRTNSCDYKFVWNFSHSYIIKGVIILAPNITQYYPVEPFKSILTVKNCLAFHGGKQLFASVSGDSIGFPWELCIKPNSFRRSVSPTAVANRTLYFRRNKTNKI